MKNSLVTVCTCITIGLLGCGRGTVADNVVPPDPSNQQEDGGGMVPPPPIQPDVVPGTLKAIHAATESVYIGQPSRAVPIAVDLEFEDGQTLQAISRSFINPVTGKAAEMRWGSTNVGVVYVTPTGVLKPVSSGQAQVWGSYEGVVVKIPVKVHLPVAPLPAVAGANVNQSGLPGPAAEVKKDGTSSNGANGVNGGSGNSNDAGYGTDTGHTPSGTSATGDPPIIHDAGIATEVTCVPTTLENGFVSEVNFFAQGRGAGWGLTSVDDVIGLPGLANRVFPQILFGPPVGSGILSPGSLDVVSLGESGTIEVEMTSGICDGDGADFIVFENATPGFVEPGRVSVSQDGINFIPFPCDATHPPYAGCAGVNSVFANPYSPDPTVASINPLDLGTAGGDPFDLHAVGLTWARYVRIEDTDSCGHATASRQLYCAAGKTGFDLDAIASLHGL